MNYKKISYICIIMLIVFSSCNRDVWKQRFVSAKMISFQKKYANSDGLSFGFNSNDSIMNFTSVKKSSKREIKKVARFLEKALALLPDSTFQKGTTMDSFYFNTNKIDYIKKNRLTTSNMHFIDKIK